jgi:hypothetical protein
LATQQTAIFSPLFPAEAVFLSAEGREALWLWVNGSDSTLSFADPVFDFVFDEFRVQGALTASIGVGEPLLVEMKNATASSLLDGSLLFADGRIVLRKGYAEVWCSVQTMDGLDPLHVVVDVATLRPPTLEVKNIVADYAETNTQFIIRSIPELAHRLYLKAAQTYLFSRALRPQPPPPTPPTRLPFSLRARRDSAAPTRPPASSKRN